MKLNRTEYRNKVLGCWLGKNVGGVVGAPYEWVRQVNDISFYTHTETTIPDGKPVANDDLDIQLLWLVALEEIGLNIKADRLAEYWLTYVTPHWAEYGIAKINMRQGLMPPISGTLNNEFKHSCGSYIRSEIWACIAPGAPELAARYAYEDAILDHGNGEGVYAEVFMAATESAAFVCGTLDEAVQIGLTYIPKDCGVAQAVHTTYECFKKKMDWKAARLEILKKHRGKAMPWGCPPSCVEEGLDNGQRGYDVPSNIALTLVGLLWGGDDFGQVQCICVNCGEDTDCTAATAGALWGILYGADAIPQKWLDPIGRSISTVCLNLGELGWFGNQLPRDVDNLTDRTLAVAERMQLQYPQAPTRLTDEKTETADTKPLARTDEGRAIWGGFTGPRFEFDLLHVHVDYGQRSVLMEAQSPKTVKLTFKNISKFQHNLNLHWYLPEGWSVTPGPDAYYMLLNEWMTDKLPTLEFTITAEKFTGASQRAVLEITIPGRSTIMLVPFIFLNGGAYPIASSQ